MIVTATVGALLLWIRARALGLVATHWRLVLAIVAALVLAAWFVASPPATRLQLAIFAAVALALGYRLALGLSPPPPRSAP